MTEIQGWIKVTATARRAGLCNSRRNTTAAQGTTVHVRYDGVGRGGGRVTVQGQDGSRTGRAGRWCGSRARAGESGSGDGGRVRQGEW